MFGMSMTFIHYLGMLMLYFTNFCLVWNVIDTFIQRLTLIYFLGMSLILLLIDCFVIFTYNIDRQEPLLLLTQLVTTICILWYHYQYLIKNKVHESAQSGMTYLNEILIGHPRKCLDIFRMSSGCFLLLVNELKRRDLLRDSRKVSVEEQLAIFLYTVGHSQRNQIMQNIFQHSGETISRYFNSTLNAILELAPYYVKQSEGECPPPIANNPLFYPFFKVTF
eukprot:TRINITY_DN1400_c2_g1_i3.p1 TRINITY_DN1400_c2_g1~~TRINITY_DN1400_c2_g1_i3.p1  ORF type:complete len:222 (+),score=4.37 TRINITY_DN1400_c2_g1_i3:852-1517(+)